MPARTVMMDADVLSAPAVRPLRLALCGGGASAVLLLNALRSRLTGALEVTLIEPRDQLALGLAYSTPCPLHLLNTRVRNMSATEDPDDLLKWLRAEHPRRPFGWTRDDFAPRALYGLYLQRKLEDVRYASNVSFRWVRSVVDSVVPRDGGWEVVPARGNPVYADVVVLATGNEPPRPLPAATDARARAFILDNPWDAAGKSEIAPDEPVLVVGTGLTAVDVIVELLHRGHRGPLYAVSRRGLLPRAHGPVNATVDGCGSTLPHSLRALVRHVRELVENDPRGKVWQSFVNDLRSIAPMLWDGWDLKERRRFLRHVRPFRDAHRHRIAPQVHSRIARAVQRGQLQILSGRIRELEALPLERAVGVLVSQRGSERRLQVERVINCTGPEIDPSRSLNPLLQNLVGDRVVRPDVLGLGIAVDRHSRVIAPDGAAHRTLYALGPLTRGSRWEVTAVAEIRDQARAVARRLALESAYPAGCARPLGALGVYRHSAA
jgi:uncharacterized NAD(P)/FAD-binding protein YdhS